MREYLFRGKRIENGEWVTGYLCYNGALDPALAIQTIRTKHDEIMWSKYTVIPETVGQFTDLTDKNGVRIFEGDIVEVEFYPNKIVKMQIVFVMGVFALWTDAGHWQRMGTPNIMYIEIIGNIHDNPELLEEENASD